MIVERVSVVGSVAGPLSDIFAQFLPPIGWATVLRRTFHEMNDDDCWGLAAQLAFYFLLALFPTVLVLVALIGYLPLDNVFNELLAAVATVAPPEVVILIRTQFDQVGTGNRVGFLTVGILGAIWSSSAATSALIDALNTAYDIKDWRAWWKRRLLAIVLTFGLAIAVVLSLALMLIGPKALTWSVAWLGLDPFVAALWQMARWPAVIVVVILVLDLMFYLAPNRHVKWVWISPGALMSTILWIGSSLAFRYYVANMSDYAAAYGAIGGAIVTMLWFYVGGLAILVGAEMNAVIEDAAREQLRADPTGQ